MPCDKHALHTVTFFGSARIDGSGHANHSTIWHYQTTDSSAAIRAPDYFTPAAPLLRKGDMIICHASDDEFVHFFKGTRT